MADPGSLRALQDELLALKHQVPGLRLQRATAAQSPAAPFPIVARAEVAAPPAADRYDVQSFEVAVRLSAGAAGAAGAAPAAAAAAAAQPGELAAAVAVEVVSSELPKVLRERMAAELHRTWQQSNPAPGRLNLALLWAAARQQYIHLLSLVPEVLEAYQSEDAWGSTVRRWAILNDQASVQIDASVHPVTRAAAAPAGRPAAAAAPAAARVAGAAAAGAARSQQQQQQQPQAVPAVAAAAGAGAPQAALRGLQQELDFLQKRYGLRLLPPGTAAASKQAAGAAAAAGTAGAADAAAAQLGGLQLSEAAAGTAAAAAAGSAAAVFELSIRPTDPAWDPAHPLLLHGTVGRGYPAPGSLALVLSAHQQPPVPALQREVLDKLLAAEVAAGAAGRPGALRQAVRHLENHGGALWARAEDIAAEVARRRRQHAEQQQAPAAAAAAAGSASGSSSELDDDGAFGGGYASSNSTVSGSASSGNGVGSESDAGGSSEEEGSGGEGGAAERRGGGHSDAVLPLALQLEGLELVDCDALELLRLNLQVVCARCRAPGELSFATAAVALPSDGPPGGRAGRAGTLAAAAECGTCHAAWAVQVAPKLLHERSNVLAHVRAEGCAPTDLLPSMLAGQCGRCASSAAFRQAAVGRWNERACSACHTPMRFQFATALFVPQAPPGSRRQAGAADSGMQQAGPGRRVAGSAAAAAAPFNGLLVVGHPLPDRGTCRHYKHSYRWLRFPCCGKRFPCDLCHEELTDGHEMKWATRMVCGYCSTEQPVAAQCKACGKKLATSAVAPSGRRTKFWEGGKGQRDPSKLDKRDPRRFRNRSKTQSAKSKRVGAEAKALREREGGQRA